MECNPKGGGGEKFSARNKGACDRVPKFSEETAACRLRGARTSVRCRRLHGKKERAEAPQGRRSRLHREAQRLPALGRKLWTLARAHDRLENCRQAQRSPRRFGGEPAPGAVVVNRGEASIDGLCRLGGKPTPPRYRRASDAAGTSRLRPRRSRPASPGAGRRPATPISWNGRPSSSQRTHTASGVEDTATASTRDWVPSFAGTHARTGRRPLPSIVAPIALARASNPRLLRRGCTDPVDDHPRLGA